MLDHVGSVSVFFSIPISKGTKSISGVYGKSSHSFMVMPQDHDNSSALGHSVVCKDLGHLDLTSEHHSCLLY